MTKLMLIAVTALTLAGGNAVAACNERCLAERALAGDGSAALQMAQNSLYKSHERMVYWYRVAAENGHRTASGTMQCG